MPLPKLPHYKKNDLRPNPSAADPTRGDLAYALGPVLMGDFGDDSAAVRPALGLPPTRPPKKKGKDDETATGWR